MHWTHELVLAGGYIGIGVMVFVFLSASRLDRIEQAISVLSEAVKIIAEKD